LVAQQIAYVMGDAQGALVPFVTNNIAVFALIELTNGDALSKARLAKPAEKVMSC